ncbi:hypothetical protein RI367_006559 [Sorochytrium milnesiophthora]
MTSGADSPTKTAAPGSPAKAAIAAHRSSSRSPTRARSVSPSKREHPHKSEAKDTTEDVDATKGAATASSEAADTRSSDTKDTKHHAAADDNSAKKEHDSNGHHHHHHHHHHHGERKEGDDEKMTDAPAASGDDDRKAKTEESSNTKDAAADGKTDNAKSDGTTTASAAASRDRRPSRRDKNADHASEDAETKTSSAPRKSSSGISRKSSGGAASSRRSNADPDVTKQSDYSTGDLVFARVKGFPYWPAKIIDISMVPDIHKKGKPRGQSYPVCFFGTFEYAFMAPDEVCPLKENLEKLRNANKSVNYKQAIKQVEETPDEVDKRVKAGLDYWNNIAEQQKMHGTRNEIAEEEEDDDDDHERTSRKSRKSSGEGRKRKTDDDEKARKKRRSSVGDTEDDGKQSASKRSQRSERKEEEAASTKHHQKPHKHSIHDRLKRMRHVLQRTFIRDKTGQPLAHEDTVGEVEWPKVVSTLDEVMEYMKADDFDLGLFWDTKVPKVIRMIKMSDFSESVRALFQQHGIEAKVADTLAALKELPPYTAKEGKSGGGDDEHKQNNGDGGDAMAQD